MEALRDRLRMLDDGQYGRVYDQLHPAQQEFIPEELYVRCTQERLPSTLDIDGIDVVETFEEEVRIAGTDVVSDSVAITVKLRLFTGSHHR